jgi:hypothetical protein
MEAIPVLSMTKDLPGLSEHWQIYVGFAGGTFWWGTTPSDEETFDEAESCPVEWIDSGDASFISEYLIENTSGNHHELASALEELSIQRPEFKPLTDEFRRLLGKT